MSVFWHVSNIASDGNMLVAGDTTLGLTQLTRQETVRSHCGQVRITVIASMKMEVAAWLEYASV